jgi:peptidyl-tRNA hydrolase
MNPILYIFLNKGLHMSSGKAAAQASHAAMMAAVNANSNDAYVWKTANEKTIIVLEARDEQHMRNIQHYLKQRKVDTQIIIDEGVNEIDPHVPTALVSNILDKDAPEETAPFSSFRLYHDIVKVTTEYEK